MRRSISAIILLASSACGDTRSLNPLGESGTGASGGESRGAESSGGSDGSGSTGSEGGGASSDGGSGSASGAEGSSSAESGAEGSSGGVLLDVGSGSGPGSGGAEAGGMGCQRIDFLFVVDNSGSMGDEQQNLADNFPRFMDAIQSTLMARDFHVMAVDTDATGTAVGSGCSVNDGVKSCTCVPSPACCQALCDGGQAQECNATPCGSIPEDPCAGTLGAGKIYAPDGALCNIQGGHRYMLDDQPDLPGTFSCAARVGTFGDGNEQPMAAMTQAVGPTLEGAGGCNEGFVRDDAVLVVTFITDEEDAMKSPGDAASWRQALIDAKQGNEQSIVVLGLIGDGHVPGGLPGGPCTADAAEPSPVLQSFVEQFTYGHLGSICAADYSSFFVDAVSFIDTACDTFIPPG